MPFSELFKSILDDKLLFSLDQAWCFDNIFEQFLPDTYKPAVKYP